MPNLRRKRKALSGFECLLEIVGLDVMLEGVKAGTHFWRERNKDCRSSNADKGAKQSVDIWDGEQICI